MPTAVPILVYHSIAAPPAGARLPSLYVPPHAFRRQMRLLRLLGYSAVTMSEAMPYLQGELMGRVAVVTLDDGFMDAATEALPILVDFGFRATCYVVSGRIGGFNDWDAGALNARTPLMDAAAIRAWHSAGMEVGAHTRTHSRLPELDAAALGEEIRGSREELESVVGAPVTQFCYPYGEYSAAALEEVAAAGYEAATTLRRGFARRGDDPLQLRRILVRGTESSYRLLLKLLTSYEDRRGRSADEIPRR